MTRVDAAASRLVGRHGEQEALRAAVAEVAGGGSVAVLLSGPPGVGKTSLAAQALTAATAAGFAAMTARASALVRDAAYAPLVAALRAHLGRLDPATLERVVTGLPGLALLMPGVVPLPAVPLGDPALEAGRLLDALVVVVERLAREQPLAILVDDVHEADPATLSWLGQLAAVATDSAVLLLLTARPDEPGRDTLGRLGSELERSSWRIERCPLLPLGDDDARSLVTAILGPGRDELAARIVQRCGGRPLFLEAVARAVSDSDGAADDLPLPESLTVQLRARIDGLGDDERAVLGLLAVAGGELDHRVLVRASELPADAALTALDRLHRRGMVLSRGDAACELAHDLLGDVVVATVSPVARMRTHARLVDALDAVSPEDPRLPEHALAAGVLLDGERARRVLADGGRRALQLGAPAVAARYLGGAVELADPAGPMLAELESERADALRRAGEPEQARAAWLVAGQEFRRLRDDVEVARVERELGLLAWSTGDPLAAATHLDAARLALEALPPSEEHAALLHARVVTATRLGDAESVANAAAELRVLAEKLDAPAVAAQAELAAAVLHFARSDYVALTERCRCALAAAEQDGDPLLLIRAHDQLSVAASSQLDLATLRAHSEASLAIARRLGAPGLQGWPLGRLACTDLLTGDWDVALRTSSEMVALAERHGERRGWVSATAGHAWVLAHLGRLAEARRLLDGARAAAPPSLERDRNIFSIVALADASLCLAEGRAAAAVAWSDLLSSTTGGWLPLLGLATLGEAHAGAGDPVAAAGVTEALRSVYSCETAAPAALADWVAGCAAGAGGDHDAVVAHMDAAATTIDELGMVFLAARARLAAARSVAALGLPGAAERATAALETFDRLGAPAQSQQARDLLRGLGVVPSRGRARAARVGDLSPRELEVARLVATGMSNAAIATRLYLSPRTVTTHLDRIYSRLGLSSRTALTRYLADSGLLSEAT